MISGPMPSPGRTATFTLEVPGELPLSLRLEGADLVRVAQREADLVQAVQQAVPAERIDLEAHHKGLIGRGDGLLLQVDDQANTRKGVALVEQAVDLGLAQDHGQEAVLAAGVVEDVGERVRE